MKKEKDIANLPVNDTDNGIDTVDKNTAISDTPILTDIDNQSYSDRLSNIDSQDTGKKKTHNTRSASKVRRVSFATHDGHALTPQEAKFIDSYIETGNGSKSVVEAGYKTKAPRQYAQELLNKPYITSEINHRLQEARNESIASAEEIMQYFTDVMRGKITDQFGLDASLSERTKAAQELAKRQIDIPNRLAGNEEPTLRIKLDFGQDDGEKSETVKPNIQIEGLSD